MDKENPIYDLLHRLDPSESALLDWLVPRIDDTHLHEIALSDYGINEEEYLQALRRIHDGQPIPIPLQWVPGEALELKRWSEPDDPDYVSPPSNSKGTRGHLIRAFCCAVLLKAGDEPETQDYIHSENNTLVQLIGSVLHLGREASEGALRFLCWRVLRMPDLEEALPFFAMALLLLYATLFQPDQDGSDLNLLVDWVMAAETKVREYNDGWRYSEEWLLGLTLFNQRHHVWSRLAQEVLLDPVKAFPEPAAATMRDIAKRLSG
jgi:hypothetical protein